MALHEHITAATHARRNCHAGAARAITTATVEAFLRSVVAAQPDVTAAALLAQLTGEETG